MVFQKVAVIGANGKLGKHLIPQLLKSQDPVFEISLLSRSEHKDEFPDRVKVHKVDYTDHASLVSALNGMDVILSTLPAALSGELDHLVAAAGREAGVRRIFPSEYTLDIIHPNVRENFPAAASRIASYDRFMSHSQNGGLSFTYLVTGGFLDLLAANYLGTCDVKNKTITVIDDGTNLVTGCTTEFIAACIIAALKMPEAETENKRIRIAEVELSGNDVVDAMEKATGEKFTVKHISSEQLLKNAEEAVKIGDWRAAYINMVLKIYFDGQGAGFFKEGLNWTAGGKLAYKRKTMLEIAQDVVAEIRACEAFDG